MSSFINIKFPFEQETTDGWIFKSDKSQKEIIRSNLLLLLLTEKNERYYKPDYGTNLRKFFFEPNDMITEGEITKDIRDTINKYIPNIKLDKIEFDRTIQEINPNAIAVKLGFTYTEDYFTFTDQLSINFGDFRN